MGEASGSGALVWLRRDLRIDDHAALSAALASGGPVYCAFVFDTEILDRLADRDDRRVEFILESLRELDAELDRASRAAGGAGAGVIVRHGSARERLPALALELGVAAVHVNRDYEPAAIRRDAEVADRLRHAGIAFEEHKDQVVFEKSEILTAGGKPFSVFTPYRKAWQRALQADDFATRETRADAAALAPLPAGERLPELADIGFERSDLASLPVQAGSSGARRLLDDFVGRIDRYHEARDFPAVKGVSYLSVHLRFGTVSIRELVRAAMRRGGEGAQCWLGELIWRDFYHQILWHHPHVVERAFKPAYDDVEWADDAEGFDAWCEGRTGYPIVDAAMRQLNQSGYMHNRLRMVSASFLTKHLGIDWREGEAYFARRLIDFDLAANNGGWQWAASTGCDAQPYFRIFNPMTQASKFDAEGRFIRRYVPELERCPDKWIAAPWTLPEAEQEALGIRIGRDYPCPVVDHKSARERTLKRFASLAG